MERTKLDLWVGLFVLAGIAALVTLAMKVGNLTGYSSSETYQVHAYFSNIGGLKPKAPVKSAGVVVGRVTSIALDQTRYEAKVVFEIDKGYQFPVDTFANILTSGLLGEQYIGLMPGGDDVMWKNGDQVEQTQSAMVLEELISKFLYSKADEKAPDAAAAPAEATPAE